MKTQKTILASIFAMLFSSAHGAQENNEIEEIEVIEITGVRGAIINARNEKLHSNGIIDAYFAEDIGKSSDEDITSALARLPGVTIERGGEGGDQGTVVVRGIQPALNLIKFNGVTLTSNTDNQGVDLSNYSADILSSIVVSKSASAKEEEGSLGGTIYLNSAAPLSNDEDVFIVGLETRYNDLTEELTPRATFAFSKNLNETFGVAGSLFFDDNVRRTNNFETFLGAFSDPRNAPFDQDGNVIPTQRALSDGFQNYRSFTHQSRKIGGTATIQWRPDSETDFRFDIAYSKQGQDFTMFEDRGVGSSFGQWNMPENLVTIDTNNGRVIEYYGPKVGLYQTREQEGETDSLVLGLDFNKTIADYWTIHSKIAYSKTSQDTGFQTWNFKSMVAPTGEPGNEYCGFKKEQGDGDLFLPVFSTCPTFDGNDLSTLGLQGGSKQERIVDDEYVGLYFDVSREFENGFITSIDAGIKYTSRTKDRFAEEAFLGMGVLMSGGYVEFDDTVGGPNGRVIPATLAMVERTPDDVLAGVAPSAANSFYAPNISAINDLLFLNGIVPADLTTRNPANQWDLEEETQAVYIQANYEFLDGDIVGNFGVRYVKTEVIGTGSVGFQLNTNYIQPNGEPYPAVSAEDDFTDVNDYSELLPSFNIKYSITDEWIVRASAARVLARPPLNSLAPGATIVDRDVGRPPSGSGGNTQLEPFLADQFDLAIEWYFNDTGLLSAGFFSKKMDSFTFTETLPRNFENPVTGEPCMVNRAAALTVEEANSATVAEYGCTDVLYTASVNGATASITGLELGYTQMFDFLPGVLSGTGVMVNYTYSDSKADVSADEDSPENGLPFPNTSENSINSVLFWENDGYSLRLAHTWRDEALITPNNNNQVIIRDERGTVDFSANWKATDNLSVSFSARNLTNSYDYLYQATMVSTDDAIPVQFTGTDLTSAPKDAAFRVNHMGRSYRLGLRYTF